MRLVHEIKKYGENYTTGFKATGIFSINPAVFSEDDFVFMEENQIQVNEQASSGGVSQSERTFSEIATVKFDPRTSTSFHMAS